MKTIAIVWHSICHNKLFSAIYIFGTALALATVTMFAVVMWTKVAPVYPEYKRGETAYFRSVEVRANDGHSSSQGAMSLYVTRDILSKLPSVKKATVFLDAWGDAYVQCDTGAPDIRVRRKPTDTAFFEIYDLKFLAGRPFDQAEFESGLYTAVITDGLARQAFGNSDWESMIGREISLDFKKYKVCGVVKQGTPTEEWSFAHIFYPYTTTNKTLRESSRHPFMGSFVLVVLTDDIESLRAEAQAVVDRENSMSDEYTVSFLQYPIDHITDTLGDNGYEDDFTIGGFLFGVGIVLLVLLIVPALNLSGMISGRMEERLAEMGVRKSFGATPGRLLRDVLWENLVLTVLGGIAGFLLAWLLLNAGIANIVAQGDYGVEAVVTSEMIFSPVIFVFTFAVCCVLNVMSALVPAWRSLRRPIVQSLKD